MAESPSGSLHYYFNHPGGELKIKNSTSELAEGVDVRGDGGMVIAPPTIRVDGQYRWLNDLEIADPPPWLIELCVEQPRVMPEAQSDPETEIWKVAAAAMAIPNDDLGRDEWNRIGMAFYRASGGSDLGLEWFTYWSAKSNKHHPENQTPRKRWEHYHKYPPNRIGGGTLVYLASEADPDWIVKFDMEMKRRFDRSQPSDKSLEQTTAEEEPKQGSEQSTAEEEQSTAEEEPKQTSKEQPKQGANLPMILKLATQLWGAQTSYQGREHEFGNKTVNIKTGAWFDFDNHEGGYLRELMKKAEVAARAAELPAPTQHWHGETDPRKDIKWLIQDVLPETGFGIIVAQWGMYKTFVALDIGVCVMTEQPFLRFATRRKGGVLFVAAEGSNTIGIRLAAVVEEKCGNAERMPFSWIDACPLLIDDNAVDELVKTATETNARMMSEFGIPLVLIVIDTIAVAAGYQERGDENDSSIGAKITATMSNLSKRTNTFVLGVDHFGKAVETGTRGTSVKETNPSTLLAILGERTLAGKTKNTRLALRKRKDGENGEEFAFRPRIVELGVDENGSAITSVIIEWQARHVEPSARDHWTSTKWLVALRKALSIVLNDHGSDFQPRDYIAPVRAVTQKQLREEFNRVYPPSTDDDPNKRKETVRKAFTRAINDARSAELIETEETGREVFIWEKPDESPM